MTQPPVQPSGSGWQSAGPGQSWQAVGGTPPASGQGPHPWLPTVVVAKPSVLPVEPREYHEFLRTPSFRWWRPLLALTMGVALYFVASVMLTLPALFYDVSTGRTTWASYGSLTGITVTPVLFLANNLALAACVPIATLTQWACFGQRPRWLSSVTGRFRWRWFGECLLWILPLYLVYLVVGMVLGGLGDLRVGPDTAFMIAAILLTTPLQAAGEEYLLRGLGQRAVASWLPRTAGLVVSTVVTAVVFMQLHGAGDPWLNGFYLFFAVVGSVLAWRTGGLEAAVALHTVNNVVSMAVLPFTDFSTMFNRQAGAGSPAVLVQAALLACALVLVLWRARVRDVVVRTAPGAPSPGAPPPDGGLPTSGGPMPSPPASTMPVTWRQDSGN
ncbi:MAG: CPBP family intramembrane metalloprotease [Micropruina sp.]|uniref:CPBP family intramembrane glutamic endopeptidase n=1 Tax=Micropruina sp. TaxID=2737536 RepID=UPI0039E5C68D